MMIIIQYWNADRNGKSSLKRKEIWKGTKEEIFKRFDKKNNSLKYCNGSYYKFPSETLLTEYQSWYDSLSDGTRFDMFYGNGTVD